MQIFRHLTVNDIHLEEFPFKRELSMEAYLIDNESILNLDRDVFNNVVIVEEELALKRGRKSKDTDGRIDILAKYPEEYIAIVELKLGQLEQVHLEQLEDYLEEKNQILKLFPDILDKGATPNPKWIGVLVGNSINPELANQMRNGYSTPDGSQIAALTLQRFRGADGSIFVTTDTYFKSNAKDNTKYLFQGNTYGKGKLVLAIIKHHVEINPKISFSALEKDFPQKCQGSNGVFAIIEEAREKADTDRKRHFIKPNEEIKLLDTTIAVCSQWGIGNINNFIDIAKEKGYIIEAKKG